MSMRTGFPAGWPGHGFDQRFWCLHDRNLQSSRKSDCAQTSDSQIVLYVLPFEKGF